MIRTDQSVSFYFFDIDDNLLFLPTHLYLWNAETKKELPISSGEFATIQNDLGRVGKWSAWSVRAETFRDFRDTRTVSSEAQTFVRDVDAALRSSAAWRGPSWPLFVHAVKNH